MTRLTQVPLSVAGLNRAWRSGAGKSEEEEPERGARPALRGIAQQAAHRRQGGDHAQAVPNQATMRNPAPLGAEAAAL